MLTILVYRESWNFINAEYKLFFGSKIFWHINQKYIPNE